VSGTIIITQSTVGSPIIPGTYRWLIVQDQEQHPQLDDGKRPEEAEWTVLGEVAQQYDLFAPYVPEQSAFQELVRQWRIQRGTRSSTMEMVLCEAYQAIIGMGPTAIPLILAQMESEGDHPDQWFWALQVLTGFDPVREEDEGNFPRMARSWLDWARSRYVW
jgi:hypothetical protein